MSDSPDNTYKLSSHPDETSSQETTPDMAENSKTQIPKIVIQQPKQGGGWISRILFFLLVMSVLLNLALIASNPQLQAGLGGPQEHYVSGDSQASAKIALIKVDTTIMPPYSERILEAIEKAKKDDNVKGVLLVIDSPGGLVSDSHRIYDRLKELQAKKPMFVSMKRIAASGGYYVAMGCGPEGQIFAEPAAWTGSIGVIIPHYDVSEFADTYGIKSKPLTTGDMKDSLSPFKPLNEQDKEIWGEIMDESYQRFVDLIRENRGDALDSEQFDEVRDGRVLTALQAQEVGLIDQIGYQKDATKALAEKVGLGKYQVVEYKHPPTVTDILLGSAQSDSPAAVYNQLIELSVPKAMYLCSWGLGMPLQTEQR